MSVWRYRCRSRRGLFKHRQPKLAKRGVIIVLILMRTFSAWNVIIYYDIITELGCTKRDLRHIAYGADKKPENNFYTRFYTAISSFEMSEF